MDDQGGIARGEAKGGPPSSVPPPLVTPLSLPAGAVTPPQAIPITVAAGIAPPLVETRICDLLREKSSTIDEIAEKVAKPVTEVLGALMRLELAKIIRRLPGSVFEMVGQTEQGLAKPTVEAPPVAGPRPGGTARPRPLANPTVEAPSVAGRRLTAGRLPINQRFVDNGDNTVTDQKHQLMWVKDPGMLGEPLGEFRVPLEVDWVTANRACEELEFAGYSDWRLPTVPEWEKLCDDISNVNPEQYLEECLNRLYWTGSESKQKPDEHYEAHVSVFGFKVSGPWDAPTVWYVRPVRTVGTVRGDERTGTQVQQSKASTQFERNGEEEGQTKRAHEAADPVPTPNANEPSQPATPAQPGKPVAATSPQRKGREQGKQELAAEIPLSLKIVPESLNGYCDKPTERLGGQTLADFHVLAVVANRGPNPAKLGAESVTFTAFTKTGQLVFVENAAAINGKSRNLGKVHILPNSEKAIKIVFHLSAELLGKVKDVERVCLDIECDSVTIRRTYIGLLPHSNELA